MADLGQQLRHARHGKADYVRVRPFDPGDETRSEALNRVPASLVAPLPARDVPRNLVGRKRAKRDQRRLDTSDLIRSLPQADTRQHLVDISGKPAQHPCFVVVVARLAEDLVVHHDGCIRAEDHCIGWRRSLQVCHATLRRGRLLRRKPPHVRRWRLVRVNRLVGVGDDDLERVAG